MRERSRPTPLARASRRFGPVLAVLVVAAMSGCASQPPGTPTSPTPEPTPTPLPTPSPDPASWPLVWSDEFDGPAGTPPDPAIWGYDLGDGSGIGNVGWGNNERQFYTASPDNAATDGNGNMLLTVRAGNGSETCYYGPCEYTSARLLTKDRYEIQYGRVEARIKVPQGFGLWPAFWMLGSDIDEVSWPKSGEIDVMEYVGRRPTWILGTIHGPGYSGGSGFTMDLDLGEPVADDFHTFAIEWWPGHIAWFFDGVKYHEASPADVAPNEWVFDHSFFMLLNVAVGGNLGGPIDPNLELPRSMLIDYLRVYQGTGL